MDLELPRFRPPQRSSWEIFLNSLWAFLLREFKNRFGATRLGYIWALLDPAMTTATFVLMHALIRGNKTSIYGESPLVFFFYGMVAYSMFMHVVNNQTNTLTQARGLFNYRQIRPIDILIAKSLIEWGMMVAVFIVVAAGCWIFGAPLPVEDPAGLLAGFTGMLLLGFAWGMCYEIYATVFTDLRRFFALSTRPLFFLSGTFYTMEMIPTEYRAYLWWNPVFHLVDLVRGAAMPGYESPGSWWYPAACVVGLLFIGLAGYRRYMHELI